MMYFSPKANLSQSGNALVYVLIAVALFAALGFTLSRQAKNSGANELDDAKIEFYVSQIIGYSAQAKSAIDQMIFSGSKIDNLEFTKPGETGFNTAPNTNKVFHPQGGGLEPSSLPSSITLDIESETAGWYMVNISNVEWTTSSSSDVILTAYQINKEICENLNKKITGSSTIPALPAAMKNYFLDTSTNSDLEISDCADCEGYLSLCVSNSAGTSFSYYTVLAEQ